MPLVLDAELDATVARHSPYLRTLLERASERALRVHAEELTLEHLVGATFEDEDCAAHEAIVHAFADPETLDAEALALSPGVMVVGSVAALPFSPRALVALETVRGEAAASGAGEIGVVELLRSAIGALDEEPRAALVERGYRPPAGSPPGEGAGVSADGPLFRCVSKAGKQVLSQANRMAHSARESSISPAWILIAALKQDAALAEACGVSPLVARELLRGRTEDRTLPTPRPLVPDPELRTFLEELPGPAGSVELLLACHGGAHDELALLLTRHKVTPPLLERARTAFEDPKD